MIAPPAAWPVAAPGALPLTDEVHVWRIPLGATGERRRELARHLSPDERTRARRLRFERDRDRYVVAHGALRELLAAYLAAPPAAILFRRDASGKPSIDASDIDFNFSRSGEIALCAIARGHALGIDVEEQRAVCDVNALAASCFSPLEIATLERVPADQRLRAFYSGWTRKEAYLKGKGTGLTVPLGEFDVSLAPDAPAALLASRLDPADPERWTLRDLTTADRYAAALAVDGARARVVCRCWTDDAPC